MTDESIVATVRALAAGSARAEYLDHVCGDDPARRARIELLLSAADAASGRQGLTPDLAPTASPAAPPPEAPDSEGEDPIDFLEPPMRPDSLGRLGHYEILQLVGRGGFGIVFRAFDDVLQRVVAIKVLAPRMAVSSPARKRFLREARGYAAVRHENVVQVHAIEAEPIPYLVMEFIPGESLDDLLTRTGPLDPEAVVRIGVQLARGLAAAHANGIVHRDIKPANILIERTPERRIKITDFGLARTADDASLTQSGMVAGTPLYMAPEQAQGGSIDHRTDLFSLGSVLYTLCTGHPPFRASTTYAVMKRVIEDTPRPVQDVIPEIPSGLCEIIARLHAKDPADRFQSATEVAERLATCLTDPAQDETARLTPVKPTHGPDATAATASPAPTRFRLPRWALLLIGVGILGGIVYGVSRWPWSNAGVRADSTATSEPGSTPNLPPAPLPPAPPAPLPPPVIPPSQPSRPVSLAEYLTAPDWEWSEPENLGTGVNGSSRDLTPCLSTDERILVFMRGNELYISQRESIDKPFGPAQRLPPSINNRVREQPALTGDGLELYFSSDREKANWHRLWVSTRQSRDEPFGEPVRVAGPINRGAWVVSPVISPDGRCLLVTTLPRAGAGSGDIVMYTRNDRSEQFGNEVILPPPINSEKHDISAWISDDRLVLIQGSQDKSTHAYRFHLRTDSSASFGPPLVLSPKFDDFDIGRPWLSPDGSRLYFHSRKILGGHGDLDLWMVRRVPKPKR